MKPDTRAFYLDAVQRVLAHLMAQLDESADLDALARLAGLSPFHFHRIFRGMVGETPLELLRRLRLERAAMLLLETEQPVTRIAFGAGYETHEAFTRAFRSSFGAAPTVFRRSSHARRILAAPSGIHITPDGGTSAFTPIDTGGQAMQVDTETLPDLRLATVTHVGPFNQIGKAFEKLSAIAGPRGYFGAPGALIIGAYHSDPDAVPLDELRSAAGVSVAADVSLPAGLEEMHIAGGTYARYTHIGPFELLGDAWQRFMGEALPASGHIVQQGPALEIYRSDMRTTPKEQLRTDLLVPVG